MTDNEAREKAATQLEACETCRLLVSGCCRNYDLHELRDDENPAARHNWGACYWFHDCIAVLHNRLPIGKSHLVTLANLPCPGFHRRRDL